MTTVPEWCVLCEPTTLKPAASVEHVFLSALGGRITTTRALCQTCNNGFSEQDDELAQFCLIARNALRIVPGRGGSPPMIRNATEDADHPGVFCDMAPGLTPVPQSARIPPKATVVPGNEYVIPAKDDDDVSRVKAIFKQRGHGEEIVSSNAVIAKVAPFFRPVSLTDKGLSSIGKTAITSAVVLFGNALVTAKVSPQVRSMIRESNRGIRNFAGFGFSTEWPLLLNKKEHPRTPGARSSDFDHSVVLADVGAHWVAYVEFFGGYRFVIVLGPRSGLDPACLIVNPTSTVCWRLTADVVAPATFVSPDLKRDRAATTLSVQTTTQRALEVAYEEGREKNASQYRDELIEMLLDAGSTESERDSVITEWMMKVATIESGLPWTTPLDLSFD